mmetsp:Transcript_11382/g.22254  ORF Transcript_11382/g.22254 Transcript_11382/m.22254 type:complete len:1193 (+) Transcript_11382:537-4115(+)
MDKADLLEEQPDDPVQENLATPQDGNSDGGLTNGAAEGESATKKKPCSKGCCGNKSSKAQEGETPAVATAGKVSAADGEEPSSSQEEPRAEAVAAETSETKSNCSKGCCGKKKEAKILPAVTPEASCKDKCCGSSNQESISVAVPVAHPVSEAKSEPSCSDGCCSKPKLETNKIEDGHGHDHGHDHGHSHGHADEGDACCTATPVKAKPCDNSPADGCCRGDQICFAKATMDPFDNSPCCPPESTCCADPDLGMVLDDYDIAAPLNEKIKASLSSDHVLLKRLCCNGEARVAQQALFMLNGVRHVRVDVETKRMLVEYEDALISIKSILALLNEKSLGAKLLPKDGRVDTRIFVTSTFNIGKLCCSSEAQIIYRVLTPLDGVEDIRPNVVLKKLTVKHAPVAVPCEMIRKLLDDQGLEPQITKNGDLLLPSPAGVKAEFLIQNLFDESGAGKIRELLARNAGISKIDIDVNAKLLTVYFEPKMITATEMSNLLQAGGFDAEATGSGNDVVIPMQSGGQSVEDKVGPMEPVAIWPKWNVNLALLCWGASLAHYWPHFGFMKYLALGAVACCLPPIALSAMNRITYGVLDINMLMTLAVIGAIALHDYSEAAAVVTLFSLSDWLEARASSKVRSAMNSLMQLAPETAILAETIPGLGTEGSVVSVELIPVGARLRVRPGDKFPVDGKLVDDAKETHANESNLTGESRPVRKGPGDEVSAGTINLDTYVEILCTREHEDSTVARMIRLVEEASNQRAPTQQLIEKIARIYTPVVFIVAILLATVPFAYSRKVGYESIYVALVFLVVACPCALVISTPMAYVCGLASAAQRGILVRGGSHLETLGRLKTMAMDKTGTLTLGQFQVVSVEMVPHAPFSREEMLSLVCDAERQSSHPIALALLKAEKSRASKVKSDFELAHTELIPGQGILASFRQKKEKSSSSDMILLIGNRALAESKGWPQSCPELAYRIREAEDRGLTALWVGTQSFGAVGYVSLGDQLRPESREAVAALHDRGVRVVMLTGDNPGAARAISADADVDEFHASLRPEDKVACLAKMEGIKGMIGDGVNDAPSLAAADVSVSLGCIGTAVALETADVALMQDDLLSLVEAVDIGRSCFRVIVQNVTFAIVLKIAVLVVTLTLYSSLWLAILADVGGMLLVTLNAMTLLSKRRSISYKRGAIMPSDESESHAYGTFA